MSKPIVLPSTVPFSIIQVRPPPKSNSPVKTPASVFIVTTALTAPIGLLIEKFQTPSTGDCADRENVANAAINRPKILFFTRILHYDQAILKTLNELTPKRVI